MNERALALKAKYNAACEEDREVIEYIMAEVIDMVTGDEGGGVLFSDPDGDGHMTVHLIGNPDLAPRMLEAAPSLYNKIFGIPDGVTTQ